MALSHARPSKKESGAKYHDYRKKKKHELGRIPRQTKLGVTRRKTIRVLGGNTKTFLFGHDSVNLRGADKKMVKAKIITVVENAANRHFVRRNILTLGTIIETDKGKARITSRPGQEGTLNAVLV